MAIWLCLLIPAIVVVALSVFFSHKMAWWEYLLQFGVPCLVILISKVTVEKVATADREFWNSYVTYAKYTEAWDTWHDETCYRQVSDGEDCTTDSDGNRHCTTRYRTESYDCSHCDHNPPTWYAYDNIGNRYSIDQSMFEELCRRWGRRDFQELNRSINYHSFCGKDGDAYYTTFDGVFEHTQPVTVVHLYENRVQASHSVFKFQKVSEEDIKKYGLYSYEYGYGVFDYNPLIGIYDPVAANKLRWWNAHLGDTKKVHMLVLVFTDQPRLAGDLQESYWCGGNKNEFVLCIGIDKDRRMQWTKVFSWTEQDRLKIDVERSIYMMFSAEGEDSVHRPVDLSLVVDSMATKVKRSFVKKSFKDFKYLSVEPSGMALLVTFVITVVVSVGLGVLFVNNDIDYNNHTGASRVVRSRYHADT